MLAPTRTADNQVSTVATEHQSTSNIQQRALGSASAFWIHLQIALKLQKLYGEDKIKILKRPGKMGLGSAYIDGLKLVTGNFIFIMDADLSHHVSPQEGATGYGPAVVCCPAVVFNMTHAGHLMLSVRTANPAQARKVVECRLLIIISFASPAMPAHADSSSHAKV